MQRGKKSYIPKPTSPTSNYSNEGEKVMKKKDMKLRIKDLFASESRNYNYKQVADLIGVKRRAGKQAVMIVLNELASEGFLAEIALGKFRRMNRLSIITGVVDLTASGSAYIIPDDGGQDVFVAQNNLMNAINGDKVKVHLFAVKAGRRPEGEVAEILERKRDSFVGIIEMSKTYAFVVFVFQRSNCSG